MSTTTLATAHSPFKKYVLEGVLTTLTPLNISEPSDARVDPATGRVSRFGDAGFPCTVTTHLRVVANAPEAVSPTGERLPIDDQTARKPTLESVPVVPANTLSGLLRRSGARIIFDSLERRGVTIPLSYYNILCCGAFTGNPDKEAPGLAQIRAASHDPYFGIFGGGPRMYAKRSRVDTGLPLCSEIAQFVPDGLGSHLVHLTPSKMTQVLWMRRGDDVSTMRNVEQMQSTITDFADAMDEYLGDSVDRKAALSTRSELKKTAAAARKSGDKVAAKAASEGVTESASRGVASLTAIQVVSPGVPFHFRVELAGNDAQLGLLLLSVERFAQNQALGGRVAKGFGRFRLHDLHLTTAGSQTEPQCCVCRRGARVGGRIRAVRVRSDCCGGHVHRRHAGHFLRAKVQALEICQIGKRASSRARRRRGRGVVM